MKTLREVSPTGTPQGSQGGETYASLTDHLLSEMREYSPADVPNVERVDSLSKLREHLLRIVCNLHSAATAAGEPITVVFQRTQTAYKADPAYRGFQLGYQNIRRVSDFLHSAGYIELILGKKGAHASGMRATPKLLELLERFEFDPAAIIRDITHQETIVLKGKKLKDGTRKVVTTPDTRRVREARYNLETINDVLQKSTIDIDIDLHELDELNWKLSSDPDKYKRPIDFTRKTLYRVFTDGDRSLRTHGRFYGGWWEGVPEELREKIIINGDPTVELDFTAIHPYILYGIEGVPVPPGDPYIIPGISEKGETRKLVKNFLLKSLNADSYASAVGATDHGYDKYRKQWRPCPVVTPSTMSPIYKALKEYHAPIRYYILSGCGNMLMNHDSDMAEEVMLHFAGKGVACLPVHDSFIVPLQHLDECWEVMRAAFMWRYGQEIPVDATPIASVAKRVSERARALGPDSIWAQVDRDIFEGTIDHELI